MAIELCIYKKFGLLLAKFKDLQVKDFTYEVYQNCQKTRS